MEGVGRDEMGRDGMRRDEACAEHGGGAKRYKAPEGQGWHVRRDE